MKKPFRTTFDNEIIEAIKIIAIKKGVHVNDILEELMRKYLEKEKK